MGIPFNTFPLSYVQARNVRLLRAFFVLLTFIKKYDIIFIDKIKIESEGKNARTCNWLMDMTTNDIS